MTMTLEEEKDWLRDRAASDGIKFFMAMFVDMHGKPCAKLVPASSLEMLLSTGAGFAGFAVGDMGQSPADPDRMAIPDPSSYMRLPWRREVAVLHCDPHVDGEPWPYSPRVILRNLLDQARDEHGWVLKTGVEAEYNLLRRDEEGRIQVADPLDTSTKPCYEAKGLSRMFDHLSRVSEHLNELGWGNYANDHEDARGQFEQNFEYDEALVTADRTIFFRYMIHMLAHEAGMTATFMGKPFSDLTGNGLHTHMSLWSTDDEPLFEGDDDPHGLGLSKVGPVPRRPARPRSGDVFPGVSDGQLLQAHRRGCADLGCHLGSGLRHLRWQQPNRDAARARRRTDREPRGVRVCQPLPLHDRDPCRRHGRNPSGSGPWRARRCGPLRPRRRCHRRDGDQAVPRDPGSRGVHASGRRRATRCVRHRQGW